MSEVIREVIRDGKFVELTYKVTDRKTGHVLTRVEFPLGYIHGHNEILSPAVHKQLEGRSAGDVIDTWVWLCINMGSGGLSRCFDGTKMV